VVDGELSAVHFAWPNGPLLGESSAHLHRIIANQMAHFDVGDATLGLHGVQPAQGRSGLLIEEACQEALAIEELVQPNRRTRIGQVDWRPHDAGRWIVVCILHKTLTFVK